MWGHLPAQLTARPSHPPPAPPPPPRHLLAKASPTSSASEPGTKGQVWLFPSTTGETEAQRGSIRDFTHASIHSLNKYQLGGCNMAGPGRLLNEQMTRRMDE